MAGGEACPPGAHMDQGVLKKTRPPPESGDGGWESWIVPPEWDMPQMLDSAAVGARQETDLC